MGSGRKQQRRNALPSADRVGNNAGLDQVESWPDGNWAVRAITGSATTKTYRCPGCDQQIRPATPHLVVWPADSEGIADRRHWHTACWPARDRRRPKIHRGRNVPRF